MKLPKIGIFFKFGLTLSLLIVVISSLLSLFLILEEQIRIEKDLKDKGISLARNLAYSSEDGVVTRNQRNLKRLVSGIMEDRDIVYAQIQDISGNVLAQNQIAQKMTRRVFNMEIPIESLKDSDYSGPFNDSRKSIKIIGQVKLGVSLARVGNVVDQVIKIILGTTLMVIILGIVGVFLVSKFFIIDPLKLILTGTRRVAQGDLNWAIPLKNEDEIGELAVSFNQMTQKVKASREELEEERKNLEVKVAERTSELQQKIDELEDFHRLAVGRELKMIELEEELAKLKKPKKSHGKF